MASVLEELVIALRVDSGKLSAELAKMIDQTRKAGGEGEKALKPFETGLTRIAAEARAGLRPLSDYRDELKKQETELRRVAAAQDKNSGEYRQTVEQLTSVKRELVGVNGELASHQTLFDKLGGRLTTFGGILSVGVTAPLALLGGTGVRSAMQLEVFQRSLETLSGDAGEAKQVFEELYEFDTKTTFSWPSLTKATTLLSAFNVEAHDLIPTLGRLGDISAAVQMDVAELADTYGRMKVSGRVTMLELNQLMGRGIPIVQELAANLGVSEGEIKNLASTGKLSFGDIERAFQTMTAEGGRFHDMMKSQTDTTQGRVMALRKEFEQVTDQIGDALLPTLDGLVDRARRAVQWFVDLDEGTRQLVINTGLFAAALGPLLLGLGQAVRVVGQLRTAFVALRAAGLLAAGPAGWIVLGVAAVAGLAFAFSGKPDSLDKSLEKANQALAGGDVKSLKGALGNVTKDLEPGSALRKELEGFRDELERTGVVGVEMADSIAEALKQVPIEAARAAVAVAEAGLAAAQVAAAQAMSGGAGVPGEQLGPLKDRVAALGRADLAMALQWNPERQSFGFPEGFDAKGVSVEVAELIAAATRAVRGEGDSQVARVTAAEAVVNEARAALEALLNPTAGKAPPPTVSPAGGTTPGVPTPAAVEEQAAEIIGILNNLNADIAELQRQRMAAESAAEILALDQAIAQKRAEYEYWDNLNKRGVAASPTATVPGARGVTASPIASVTPAVNIPPAAAFAIVEGFNLSIRDVERLSRAAWESFLTANSEEDRRRFKEEYDRLQALKAELERPFTPQPIPAAAPSAGALPWRDLTAPGVTAGGMPWRDLTGAGPFAQLDAEQTAFVAKVRGELTAAMDLAASKAEALGEAYDLPKEQLRLTQAAIMQLIEGGLLPASPAVQALTGDFAKYAQVLQGIADQDARVKAFQDAVVFARDAMGELPGPLEENITTLQAYRESLDLSEEGAQALAVELDRLIAGLERLKGIEDSGLRKFAGDVNALAATLPGLGGTFARSTGLVAEGLHKIAETDDKLIGTALVIRGVTTAIEGIAAAASDGGLDGNEIMELVGGIASVAAEAIGTLTGIPGLGQVVSAAFSLITLAVGDLSDGLAEIEEQIDDTTKRVPLLARETVDAFAREYTRQVSAGGSFGRTKAELDQELFDAAIELAGSFAATLATAMAAADFEGSLDLGFDQMIRDQRIEAFILSPEVQAQIKAMVEFWQDAWEDGVLTDAERARWDALRQGLIESGRATREQLKELGLIEDEEEQKRKNRTGGARITDLTGPARDHFADLLAPLRHLGAQLTELQGIRGLLQDRLPKGNWGSSTAAAPGGGVIINGPLTVTTTAANARELFDEISLIAARKNRGK